jgi:hypothetical protein
MTEISEKFPPLFIAACIFVCLGLILLACALFFMDRPVYLRVWGGIATGLMVFGAGEILNHPREQIFRPEQPEEGGKNFRRRRNTCGLGNLLDIIALLLFFIGLSSML